MLIGKHPSAHQEPGWRHLNPKPAVLTIHIPMISLLIPTLWSLCIHCDRVPSDGDLNLSNNLLIFSGQNLTGDVESQQHFTGFSLVNEPDTGPWLATDWRLHDIPDSQVAHSLHGSVPHERLCPDYFVIIIVWVSSSQASLWYRMNQMSAGKTTGFLLHLKFCQNNIAARKQKGESGWLSPAPPLVIRTYFNAKFSSDLKTNPLKIQYSWLTFVNFQRLVKSTPLMGVAEKGAGTAFGHQEIWHSSG